MFRSERPRRTFKALHAGIRVQREDEHVAQRTCFFEEADVAGMKQVITAVGEHDGFSSRFPLSALPHQFITRIKNAHNPNVGQVCTLFNPGSLRRASMRYGVCRESNSLQFNKLFDGMRAARSLLTYRCTAPARPIMGQTSTMDSPRAT
jgi:hypothetical protein